MGCGKSKPKEEVPAPTSEPMKKTDPIPEPKSVKEPVNVEPEPVTGSVKPPPEPMKEPDPPEEFEDAPAQIEKVREKVDEDTESSCKPGSAADSWSVSAMYNRHIEAIEQKERYNRKILDTRETFSRIKAEVEEVLSRRQSRATSRAGMGQTGILSGFETEFSKQHTEASKDPTVLTKEQASALFEQINGTLRVNTFRSGTFRSGTNKSGTFHSNWTKKESSPKGSRYHAEGSRYNDPASDPKIRTLEDGPTIMAGGSVISPSRQEDVETARDGTVQMSQTGTGPAGSRAGTMIAGSRAGTVLNSRDGTLYNDSVHVETVIIDELDATTVAHSRLDGGSPMSRDETTQYLGHSRLNSQEGERMTVTSQIASQLGSPSNRLSNQRSTELGSPSVKASQRDGSAQPQQPRLDPIPDNTLKSNITWHEAIVDSKAYREELLKNGKASIGLSPSTMQAKIYQEKIQEKIDLVLANRDAHVHMYRSHHGYLSCLDPTNSDYYNSRSDFGDLGNSECPPTENYSLSAAELSLSLPTASSTHSTSLSPIRKSSSTRKAPPFAHVVSERKKMEYAALPDTIVWDSSDNRYYAIKSWEGDNIQYSPKRMRSVQDDERELFFSKYKNYFTKDFHVRSEYKKMAPLGIEYRKEMTERIARLARVEKGEEEERTIGEEKEERRRLKETFKDWYYRRMNPETDFYNMKEADRIGRQNKPKDEPKKDERRSSISVPFSMRRRSLSMGVPCRMGVLSSTMGVGIKKTGRSIATDSENGSNSDNEFNKEPQYSERLFPQSTSMALMRSVSFAVTAIRTAGSMMSNATTTKATINKPPGTNAIINQASDTGGSANIDPPIHTVSDTAARGVSDALLKEDDSDSAMEQALGTIAMGLDSPLLAILKDGQPSQTGPNVEALHSAEGESRAAADDVSNKAEEISKAEVIYEAELEISKASNAQTPAEEVCNAGEAPEEPSKSDVPAQLAAEEAGTGGDEIHNDDSNEFEHIEGNHAHDLGATSGGDSFSTQVKTQTSIPPINISIISPDQQAPGSAAVNHAGVDVNHAGLRKKDLEILAVTRNRMGNDSMWSQQGNTPIQPGKPSSSVQRSSSYSPHNNDSFSPPKAAPYGNNQTLFSVSREPEIAIPGLGPDDEPFSYEEIEQLEKIGALQRMAVMAAKERQERNAALSMNPEKLKKERLKKIEEEQEQQDVHKTQEEKDHEKEEDEKEKEIGRDQELQSNWKNMDLCETKVEQAQGKARMIQAEFMMQNASRLFSLLSPERNGGQYLTMKEQKDIMKKYKYGTTAWKYDD